MNTNNQVPLHTQVLKFIYQILQTALFSPTRVYRLIRFLALFGLGIPCSIMAPKLFIFFALNVVTVGIIIELLKEKWLAESAAKFADHRQQLELFIATDTTPNPNRPSTSQAFSAAEIVQTLVQILLNISLLTFATQAVFRFFGLHNSTIAWTLLALLIVLCTAYAIQILFVEHNKSTALQKLLNLAQTQYPTLNTLRFPSKKSGYWYGIIAPLLLCLVVGAAGFFSIQYLTLTDTLSTLWQQPHLSAIVVGIVAGLVALGAFIWLYRSDRINIFYRALLAVLAFYTGCSTIMVGAYSFVALFNYVLPQSYRIIVSFYGVPALFNALVLVAGLLVGTLYCHGYWQQAKLKDQIVLYAKKLTASELEQHSNPKIMVTRSRTTTLSSYQQNADIPAVIG